MIIDLNPYGLKWEIDTSKTTEHIVTGDSNKDLKDKIFIYNNSGTVNIQGSNISFNTSAEPFITGTYGSLY